MAVHYCQVCLDEYEKRRVEYIKGGAAYMAGFPDYPAPVDHPRAHMRGCHHCGVEFHAVRYRRYHDKACKQKAYRARKKKAVWKSCAWCGVRFKAQTARAKYHDKACKQKAYRARKAQGQGHLDLYPE